MRSPFRPPPEFDEYRILRAIGSGGMGQVYLAHDTLLDRPVAAKFMAAFSPAPVERQRFLVEARAAARLQHPNVVAIHRVGELQNRPYLISEFVRGESLDRLPKPVPWPRALELGRGLSRGLAAAHRRGVLHRDIKPANAILGEDGVIKLLDFGLAKLLEGSSEASEPLPELPVVASSEIPTWAPPRRAGASSTLTDELTAPPWDGFEPQGLRRSEVASLRVPRPTTSPALTRAGALMGTPLYMAPEVWRGQGASKRSDIYSMGALLYELCAGRPPHRAATIVALGRMVCETDVEPLSRVAPAIDQRFAAVVERCLARDPAQRYESGDALHEALEQLVPQGSPEPIPAGNPYRGLRAFEAQHRGLFFGRSDEIGALLDRLGTDPFVIVSGESGVGKSSLCRAGLLPRILDGALGEGRTWSVVTLVPGRHPLEALGAMLAPYLDAREELVVQCLSEELDGLGRRLRAHQGGAAGLVIFVDQLEELVTLADAREQQAIGEVLGRLAMRTPGLRLLAAARADFLVRLASIPGLGDEVSRALHLLRPLSPQQMRQAIVGPADKSGVRFESEALVETLVQSTAATEGGLPLLQFALAELWEARDTGKQVITAEALTSIGGVGGALARHADSILAALLPTERAAARRLLARLVTAEGTRAQRSADELAVGDPAGRAALEGLVRGRLLVARDVGEGTVYEVAHEALLSGWATLREWLGEQAEGRAVRQRLEAAAAEWERLGRARETLWSDRRLREVTLVDLRDCAAREAAFVAASRAAVRRGRSRIYALALGLPLALASVYLGVALQARHERDRLVEARRREAVVPLDQARSRTEELERLRSQAFARFDAEATSEAEEAWGRTLELEDAAENGYSRAGSALQAALAVDHTRVDVRALLADLLLERTLGAERARRWAQRDELLSQLALYDDGGARRARIRAPAYLSVTSSPAGARVSLERYTVEPGPRRAIPVAGAATTPLELGPLEPGSYRLLIQAPGRVLVRLPVLLGRAERLALSVTPPRAVPEGFVYVPPGRFLYGSADESLRTLFMSAAPLHEVRTPGYLIRRTETTFADWMEYLRALPPTERTRRIPRVAGGSVRGGLELVSRGEGFELAIRPGARLYVARSGERLRYSARDRRATQTWQLAPVLGVSCEDAQHYAAWLSSTGQVPGARLCTEQEWERAARGADDRVFPHGDRLRPDDANYDQTYGKQPLGFGPDEVGAHPTSRSPFGVDDMAGNAWEYTLGPAGACVARGGGYQQAPAACQSANREVVASSLRDVTIGLRVCASLPP